MVHTSGWVRRFLLLPATQFMFEIVDPFFLVVLMVVCVGKVDEVGAAARRPPPHHRVATCVCHACSCTCVCVFVCVFVCV